MWESIWLYAFRDDGITGKWELICGSMNTRRWARLLKQRVLFIVCRPRKTNFRFLFLFAANKWIFAISIPFSVSAFSVCGIPETWRDGYRDMGIESWTWRHGHGGMDMGAWTWGHGHGGMDMEAWTWRHGHGGMEMEAWTWSHGHGVM